MYIRLYICAYIYICIYIVMHIHACAVCRGPELDLTYRESEFDSERCFPARVPDHMIHGSAVCRGYEFESVYRGSEFEPDFRSSFIYLNI